jgi:1,2-diacylglycerol 3-beta-galactosyltransferase
MTRLQLIYFNAGGGHRAAALALESVIASQQRPWQVSRVNLFEVLDPQAQFRKLTGATPEAYYNWRLARGWTLGLAQELKLLQAAIRVAHPALVERLQRHWLDTRPDLVISLVPNFNRALAQSLYRVASDVPFVTVLTDMADYPPHFWIERGRKTHVVCGSSRAVQQARALGHDEHTIHRTSGMILRPDFYQPAAPDRVAARQSLGLDGVTPTGVVMFGGQGSNAMRGVAQQLHDVPLILMCGHNQALAAQLRAQPASAPRVVVEHTQQVARYLRLGDFFIGKPGPGCLSEALHCGLPVITSRNAWTMPQERYNTDWVREQGVGLVTSRLSGLRPAVDELVARLPEMAARVACLDNRAVFEVPQILAGILDAQAPVDSAALAGVRHGRVAHASSAANDARAAALYP